MTLCVRLHWVLGLWLLLLATSFIPSTTLGYDPQTRHTSAGYDVGSPSATDYDSASVLLGNETNTRAIVDYAFFAQIAEFVAAEAGTTLDQLSAAANRAAQSVGSGSGPVYGTQVHTAFQAEVEALGQSGLRTEVSYLNGAEVPYGTPGSFRIDVGQYGANGQIQSVFDLKTGSATLTPARIQQIQQAVGSPVPVTKVRP